eukprot:c23238_g1_i1.p1 GENE.c23238_g1_i1~~c23238_g1_i1.p1  ORF type:complete len:799 (+),score=170.52 c23238_g1_i1:41-2437(+)
MDDFDLQANTKAMNTRRERRQSEGSTASAAPTMLTGFALQVARFRMSKFARVQRKVRTHVLYAVAMGLMTVFAVFMEDIRLAVLPKSSDVAVDIAMSVAFAFFSNEIFFAVLFEPGYATSLMLSLDVAATISILIPLLIGSSQSSNLFITRLARVLQVLRVMRSARLTFGGATVVIDRSAGKREKGRKQMMLREMSTDPFQMNNLDEEDLNAADDIQAKQISEAHTEGNQTSSTDHSRRYSETTTAPNTQRKKSLAPSITSVKTSPDSFSDGTSSMIGQTLLRAMAEKIIIAVLLMAVGLQLLETRWQDRTIATGISAIDREFDFFNGTGCFVDESCSRSTWCVITPCCCHWADIIEGYGYDVAGAGGITPPEVRMLRVRGHVFVNKAVSYIRDQSIMHVALEGSTEVKVDVSGIDATDSLWSIAKTVLIMLLLLYLPIAFGRDISVVVIQPLESLYDRIQQMSRKPFKNLEIQNITLSKRYEIDAIGLAINKLMKLLHLGLGQAGSEIVARNMDSGEFNARVDGQRVDAIFGFCCIHDFAECCEVLGEQTMIFTNLIATLVGEIVTMSHGSVNKNLGEAFLVVWKLPEDPRSQRMIAESAVSAFIQIRYALAKHVQIQRHARDEAMVAKFGPNFRFQMGYGLHVGWAIEGAVGSNHKIDATYLSPHVNLASRLESATVQYGVPLLMSSNLVDLLPETSLAWCRRVDVVTLKGTSRPMQLYTCLPAAGSVLPERRKIANSQIYLDLYLDGRWDAAKEAIQSFLNRYPKDGPATAILRYMQSREFQCPEKWSGCRNIDK